jgi:hypothetical protein
MHVEQVMGIEPTLPAWEAGVLPLNYTCIGAEDGNRTHDLIITSDVLYRLSYFS